MAREPRSRLDRIFGGPVPEQPTEPELVTMAIDAANTATAYALLEHELAEERIARRRAEDEREQVIEDNEQLRRRVNELQDELADVRTRELPDVLGVYRRMVEADTKIDRPFPDIITQFCNGCGTELIAADDFARVGLCADCDDNGRPDLVEWQDVVTPSSNGTTT